MITLGVLSDTHVPDKAPELNPQVAARFRQEMVSAILHAGDVTSPQVLKELKKIAPVHAVHNAAHDARHVHAFPCH